MCKHLGWYARNLPGASELHRALVQTSSAVQVEMLIAHSLDYRSSWEGVASPQQIQERT
jgi:hypothetical protein